MKQVKPLLAVISLIFFSIAATSSVADNSSHVQQVQTLFKLTQMEKKVNESIDSIMQLQLNQSPGLAQHEAAMRAFFERQIGWAALKDDITQMYLRTFTEEELKAINDFYITPAGQKVITALPGLVQERNQLAMMRLQQNIGELQQIVGQPAAQ
ncbi:MAG: DUF2059 domain-containing protein [Thiotrichales bacterium]|nr:MAG: DUF2059 domain-containing protein [Thiotrichales bacterium]